MLDAVERRLRAESGSWVSRPETFEAFLKQETSRDSLTTDRHVEELY